MNTAFHPPVKSSARGDSNGRGAAMLASAWSAWGALEEFMRSPPEGVCVLHDHAHVDAEQILLPISWMRQSYQTFGNLHSSARF